MNFNAFFNQWRPQPASAISDLIDSPGITLARLLDEDQFQSEYKSGNTKVAEFMKYEKYEQLLQFVTIVGPAQDKKRSFKYPLIACELLCIENTNANLTELFLPERPIFIEKKEIEEVEEEVEVQIQQPKKTQTQDSNIQNRQENSVGQIEELKYSQLEASVQAEAKTSQETRQEVIPDTNELIKVKDQAQTAKQHQKNKFTTTKKITKKVEKVIQEKKQPLILKLLSYFSGEVNYTLAGYVSRILGFLLTKKPVEFFKYVLQEKIMHNIINHAESRSVGELIVKILTHESVYSLDLHQKFYKQLLSRLSVPSEIHVISNLSAYVSEIIEKVAWNLKSNNKIVQLSNLFFSLQIITQVIKNVMSEEESVSVYNAPILLTYLTNFPFTLPQDQKLIEEFRKLGQLFVEKCCEKLKVQSRSKPKLGVGRIKLLEILRSLLKQNLLNLKQTVANKPQFFPILLNLIKQYQMNNVLHNQIIKILEIALTQPEGSNLNNSILSQNILLNFIHSETEEDKNIRAKDSIYKSRKGYIAHVINLSVRLRQLSEKNSKIKQLTESSDFLSLYDTFIEKQTFNSRKSLAGFIKKDTKHEIMFLKEDIIAGYLTFFQKCPSAVFQPEPMAEQPVNIQHSDLVEQLQKQLEQSMNIKSKQQGQTSEAPIRDEQKVSEKQVEQEQMAQGQYWSTHLQYSVDDLMNNL